MYKIEIDTNKCMMLFVNKSGEPCFYIKDQSRLFNRYKYFDQPVENNPNYKWYLRKKEAERKASRVGKPYVEPTQDYTETLPAFNFNHNSEKYTATINRWLKEDEKCYGALKQGKIVYAQEEINAFQHQLNCLQSNQDRIDFMAALQRRKRHAKMIALIRQESENRRTLRSMGYSGMSNFRLSYISQTYVALLYSWGYSAESIEALMSLKNGYINKITKNIKQHAKREYIIEFADDTALGWGTLEKFSQLPLTTGRNLTQQQIKRIQELYSVCGDIKRVAEIAGVTTKTVRYWTQQ